MHLGQCSQRRCKAVHCRLLAAAGAAAGAAASGAALLWRCVCEGGQPCQQLCWQYCAGATLFVQQGWVFHGRFRRGSKSVSEAAGHMRIMWAVHMRSLNAAWCAVAGWQTCLLCAVSCQNQVCCLSMYSVPVGYGIRAGQALHSCSVSSCCCESVPSMGHAASWGGAVQSFFGRSSGVVCYGTCGVHHGTVWRRVYA